MADATVDKLKIEIEASAKKASSSIDKLIEYVGKLQEVTESIETGKLAELGSAISNLTSSMSNLPKSSAFNSLVRGIEKLNGADTSRLREINGALNDLAGSVQALNNSGISDVRLNVRTSGVSAENISPVVDDGFVAEMEHVAAATEEVEQAAEDAVSGLEHVAASEEQAGRESSSLTERMSGVQSALSRVGQIARSGHGAMKTLASKVLSVVKAFTKFKSQIGLSGGSMLSLADKIRNVGSAFTRLSSKLAKVTRLFSFMLLRKAITALFSSLGTAIEHLAQKSSSFNEQISELQSTLALFSHQVAALAEPLLNIFGPALTKIISILSTATSYVNQFLSALTGKNVFTSAKKVATDYAASLSDVASAAKKVTNATVGIDELNIISQNDSSSDSDSDDLEDCYEELAINQKILDIVEELKELLASVFEPMKQSWNDYGQGVIDAFQYAIDSIYQTMKSIGATWIEVWTNGSGYELCSNILLLLTSILDWIGDIATAWGAAWKEKGTDYVQSKFDKLNAILSLITTISESFRKAFSGGSGREALEHIYQILTNCNNTIANLANNFKAAWDEMGTGDAIAQALFDILNSILATIEKITGSVKEWAANLDFGPLLESSKDLLEAISPIVDDIGKAFDWLFTEIIEPAATWIIEQGLPTVLETIAAALQKIHEAISEADPETLDALGKALLGIVAAIEVVSVITKISTAIQTLMATISGIGIVARIGEVISLVTGGAGTVSEAMSTVFGTVGTVFAGIASILAGAVLAVTNFVSMWQDGFNVVKEVLMVVGIAIAAVGAVILGVPATVAAVVAAIVAAVASLVVLIKEHWSEIKEFFAEIPSWFAGIWEKVKTFCVEKWNALLEYLSSIPQKISEIITKVGDWFAELPGKIGYALGYALGKIVSWCTDVKDWFAELPGKIYDAISSTATKVATWAKEVSEKFKEKVQEIVSNVKEWFAELPGKIYDAIITVKEKITQWVTDVKKFCTEKVPEIIDNIVEFFKGIPEKLKELGTDIIDGLINGIKSAWESLKQKVSDFIDGFVQGFKDALGIHSPSTVFEGIGGNVVDGLINGITSFASTCAETIKGWATNVINWFTGGNGSGNIIEKFKTAAGDIVTGFKDKVVNTYETVKSNVTTWASKVKSWFTSDGGVNSSTFQTYAKNTIDGFKTKIGSYYTAVKSNITTWASKVKSYFTSDGGVSKSTFQTYAKNVVDGFKTKIGSYYTECKDTIQSWGNSVASWFKSALGINSPSRVFAELGGFTVAGLNEGIEDNADSTTDCVDNWIGKFSDIQANIGLKFNVKEELENYTPNYDSGISADTIVRTVKESVSTEGAVKAILESGSSFADAFKEAIDETLSRKLENIETYTKTQAEKSETTKVYVGDREVAKSVEKQKAANGFSFTPATA